MIQSATQLDLKPGQIAFYEAVRPPLVALDYKLSAEQNVTGLPPSDGTPSYQLDQLFTVSAPRFTLDGWLDSVLISNEVICWSKSSL